MSRRERERYADTEIPLQNPGREKIITVVFVKNCGIIYVWIK